MTRLTSDGDMVSTSEAAWNQQRREKPVQKSVNSVQDKVYQQLLGNYPPKSIAWVKNNLSSSRASMALISSRPASDFMT